MKKLLPPVLFAIFAICMGLVCWALDSPHTLSFPYALIGLFFFVPGLGISIYHSRLFKKLGVNIMTFDEPTKIVKTGLFRYTRNPMYLGFVLALLGIAFLYHGAISSFLFVVLFWYITDRWYIRYEEKEMERNKKIEADRISMMQQQQTQRNKPWPNCGQHRRGQAKLVVR